MSQPELAGEGYVFRQSASVSAGWLARNFLSRRCSRRYRTGLFLYGTVAADVARAGLHIELDVGDMRHPVPRCAASP